MLPPPGVNLAGLAPALVALSAIGEETRLRILMLIGEAELTVSELVAILGQSQPRVSRHLKLLVEARLAQRHREGAWAFFRIALDGAGAQMTRGILAGLDADDPVFAADRARLAEIRTARAAHAARYFATHARAWDHVRSLHVPEARVEGAIRDMLGNERVRCLLDCGTGTGRMLELLASHADQAIGVDLSPAMLAVARANLERANIRGVQLRQGDIYALPVERNSCDLVIVHQVLHYLDDPARALREAARALAPGGRLIAVDFAPHDDESLREGHAHRRLGFARSEVETLLAEANLEPTAHKDLAPGAGESGKLTVSIWLARDPRVIADPAPRRQTEFA